MLDERKRVDRAAQHTRAATRLDGGWDAIAEEPEKCTWGGGGDKLRLEGVWERARDRLGHLPRTKSTRLITKRIFVERLRTL